jgi:hypothetical protein
MGVHHTKDKGDLGVAKVFADLVEQGLAILFPATEHAPFDLVAYDGDRFIRIQVKYRSARRGVVRVYFRSVWNDRHGTHVRPMDKASVDVVALYCPEVDQCFYVDPSGVGGGVTLRLDPAANRQEVGVRYADQFRQMPDIESVSRSLDESAVPLPSSTLVG